MKTLKLLILALSLATITARAQINTSNLVLSLTTNTVQQTAIDRGLAAIGAGISSYSIDPYFTYAPSAPTKFGGGLLGLYNFNNYAAAGLGLDWLGQFSLVSGDLQLQAPFHLSSVATFLANTNNPSWVLAIGHTEIVPFALGGLGTPYSGNGHFNGSAMVIGDVGGAIKFGHLWGGEFDLGVCWGKWQGSGPYGGVTRYHLFAGYTYGF
ncbi:MAG: hypothetical protein KGL39_15635 [Patescibacteria group bacterium]|nr:hypothetical protein [Patescibacteria group bacterium]